MARPVKIGFDYFPFDVNIFSDIKIKKLIRKYKTEAFSIYTHIVCQIYKEGYYLKFDPDLFFFITDDLKNDEHFTEDVFNYCLEIDLFNKKLFDQYKIITSLGIQKRFLTMCINSKRTSKITEFNLVNSEETIVNSEEMLINSELSTQSIVKEIKEEENKGLIFKIPESHNLYSKEVEKRFNEYLSVRLTFIKKPSCNQVVYQGLLRSLSILTEDKKIALQIIDQSINGSYPDFYQLKTNGQPRSDTGKYQERYNSGKKDYSDKTL